LAHGINNSTRLEVRLLHVPPSHSRVSSPQTSQTSVHPTWSPTLLPGIECRRAFALPVRPFTLLLTPHTCATPTRQHDRGVVFCPLVSGVFTPCAQECTCSNMGSPSLSLSAPNTKQQPLTTDEMQPQQQLSQIEKSVTHLLVATKQLLGPSTAHAAPHTTPANTLQRR
jgi:hypothetical protein